MNPRIFDVNKKCRLIISYFIQADKTIKFLYELSICLFLVWYTYNFYELPSEIEFILLGVGVFKAIILVYGLFPLLTCFLFLYFGVLFIFLGILLRLINYLVFIFRTPWYIDMMWPEE
jgi:hypothetical protein